MAGGAAVPSTTVSQTGELARVTNWVSDAYIDIQNRHSESFRWQRRLFEVVTAASDGGVYAYDNAGINDVTGGASNPIDRFSSWRLDDRVDPPRIHLVSAGSATQNWMIWVEWDWFRLVYRTGLQNPGYPRYITVDPQNNIVIGPEPNDIYNIQSYYERGPQVLGATNTIADDTEVSGMPAQFHKLIVYKALEKYGYFESAGEVIARAQKEGNRMMRQLEGNQMPAMRMRGPLA